MGRRQGRPRAGQGALTREGILAAALELVDAEGVEGLTMRRLAGALGVDPMAIYHHLDGKEAIIRGLVEGVFAALRVPELPGARWQERVCAFATAYRSLLLAHPNLVLALIADADLMTEGVLLANEALYAALDDAGLAPEQIVRAADLIIDYLHGFMLSERSARYDKSSERTDLFALVRDAQPEKVPTLRRVLEAVSPERTAVDMDAGLAIILRGIEGLVVK